MSLLSPSRTDEAPLTPEQRRVSDQALISDLNKKWDEAEKAQRDLERQWWENIAFLEGQQYLRSVPDRGLFNTTGLAKRGRLREVDNRLFDHARRLHARLDAVRYEPTVIADTDDPGDRMAAKSASAAVRWFTRRRHVQQEKRKANWWIVATGRAYLEPFFDPDMGKVEEVPELDPETGEVVYIDATDDAGNPILIDQEQPDPITGEIVITQVPKRVPKMALKAIGDLDFVVRSPFQCKPDPRFEDWRKKRWFFVEELAAKEEVIDRFGDDVPDLEKRLADVQPLQTAPWIPDLPSSSTDLTGIPKPLPPVSGVVRVRRYYEKPCKKYPNGRHVVYAADSDVKLYEGDLGSNASERQFLIPLGYLERPWTFSGKSPISEGKGLQRLYNRIFMRALEHLVRLPAGWLLVPTTSGIPKRAFTSESGAIIRYAPGGGSPSFVFPPFQGLAWYDRYLSRIETSMEERMALPPATRGQMPKGARAAKTIELLQEAADAIQAPVLNDLGDAWAEFYTQVLMLMRQHFTVTRMISLIGPDKQAETMEFRGDVLPVDWRDRLTVKVEAGESLPSSRSARIDFIFGLAEKGMFPGKPGTPEYVRAVRDALELDAGFIPTGEDLDITIAENENLLLLRGGETEVRKYDDTLVHLRVHLTFFKRLLAADRVEDAQRLMPHIEATEAQLQQKMAESAPPAPPQPPAPPETVGAEQQPAEGFGGSESVSGEAMPGAESQETAPIPVAAT